MTAIRFALLLLLLGSAAEANVHGLDSVRVVPAVEPPEYDLDQIETEVARTVKRSERNLRIRVALVRLGPSVAGSNDCSFMFGFGLLCEAANSVERAVARAEARQTISELKQAHIESDPALAPDLAGDVDQLLASNLLQVRLARAVRDVIKDQTDIEVHYGQDTSNSKYRLDSKLVSVRALGRRTDPRVAIRLTGRLDLVDTDNETAIDSYEYTAATPPHLIENWSQGGVGLLAASITNTIESMAQVLTEEILLTVTSPKQRKKGYLVEPISPKNKTCVLSCKFTAMGSYGFFATDALQPTFAWEDFRTAYDKDPLYADIAAEDIEVSYELRIFRAGPSATVFQSPLGGSGEGAPILRSKEQVYEFRGITGTTFTPEVSLAACTPYLWTARARFVAAGKTHLTNWSGNYKEKKIEKYRKDRVSQKKGVRTARAIGGFMGIEQDELYDQAMYFFPFLVTSPGQKCKEKDIRAAMERQ